MIEFYAVHKLLVWLIAVTLSVAGCLIYYFSFGPHTTAFKGTSSSTLVQRFGRREWLSHWLIMLGFIALTVTGFMQVVPGAALVPLGPFHGWLGFIFFLLSMATLLGWLKDALFHQYDLLWIQKMGGYLSHNPRPLPAGRFNAGQKIYYWSLLIVLVGLLVSAIAMEHGSHSPEGRRELFWCIHGLLGCLATIMVIGHGFLSIFVNPDTTRVLLCGSVSKAYTDEYHSLWNARQ